VLAALGDPRRLALLVRLSDGNPHSITRLAEGASVTRQAVTKHLRVLESAGIVRCMRRGRESLFAFNPEPIDEVRAWLDRISARWDNTLARLKSFVEK
jgi:DNA-binding transcriptional ArsR family regulator